MRCVDTLSQTGKSIPWERCTTLVEQRVHQRMRMHELEVVEKRMGFQFQGSWRRRVEVEVNEGQ
ncbi:hypothetical protein Taro_046224 [Colocasia esculenta]|uniref:Uncharacterized protein n=1 Tax=Colocasia esculenta TaxID=4460 RepID=A0A843WYG3_COLES|nr:hypothetical protein [Colocasia esculenta]